MTPKEFRDKVLYQKIDVDNFPKANPYQCYDLLAYCNRLLGIDVDTYCAITGYVCDLWRLRDQYGYSTFFDYIYSPGELVNGDWCFWDKYSSHKLSHVAMFYEGKELGQNQGSPWVTEKDTTWDIMGALRPKFWKAPERGYAEYYDPDIAGTYSCKAPLNLRTGGSTEYPSIKVMRKGDKVNNFGYYHKDSKGTCWLYVTSGNCTGFACMNYLNLC